MKDDVHRSDGEEALGRGTHVAAVRRKNLSRDGDRQGQTEQGGVGTRGRKVFKGLSK